jgi:RNA polymerase sigma factor for flagellar operon FliA
VDDLQSCWAEYRTTRDPSLRDRLTLQYSPLAKFVAGRIGGQTATALEALVGAIETFDGNDRFEGWAMQRMASAVVVENHLYPIDSFDIPVW